MSTSIRRIALGFCTLVVCLAALRIVWAVFITPTVGYANNYDFVRQSACLGLWQDYGDRGKTEGNYLKFVDRLAYDGDRHQWECVWSSDHVYAWLLTRVLPLGSKLGFAPIAALKLSALAVACGLVLFWLWRLRCFALVMGYALALALVMSDMVMMPFVNTLYADFSVDAAAMVLVGVCMLWGQSTNVPKLGVMALTLLVLVWLGLSKQQYFHGFYL